MNDSLNISEDCSQVSVKYQPIFFTVFGNMVCFLINFTQITLDEK